MLIRQASSFTAYVSLANAMETAMKSATEDWLQSIVGHTLGDKVIQAYVQTSSIVDRSASLLGLFAAGYYSCCIEKDRRECRNDESDRTRSRQISCLAADETSSLCMGDVQLFLFRSLPHSLQAATWFLPSHAA